MLVVPFLYSAMRKLLKILVFEVVLNTLVYKKKIFKSGKSMEM